MPIKEVSPRVGDLRVWWVTNPPHQGARHPVRNVKEAIVKLDELTKRDLALGKLVFCNAGGLEMFDGDGGWSEFHDEDDRDIDAIADAYHENPESYA